MTHLELLCCDEHAAHRHQLQHTARNTLQDEMTSSRKQKHQQESAQVSYHVLVLLLL
jgi:hypothetical protein